MPGNKTHSFLEQFKKYKVTDAHHLGAPYDTCSVMHYLDTAFSKVSNSYQKKDTPAYNITQWARNGFEFFEE